MLPLIKAAVLMIVLLWGVGAVGQDIASEPVPGEKKVLRFAVNPWGSEEEMRQKYRPLIKYLEDQLNVKIEVIIPGTYDELLDRLARGEFQLMCLNSVSLLKALRQGLPIEYLATAVTLEEGETKGRDYYEGFIIVRKDSRYKTFRDLKGKTFAFVDKSSASGYKMPLAILGLEEHTNPDEFFKKYFFVGDHNEVAGAVYYGCVDGGATWDYSYSVNSSPDKFGQAFRIIRRTPKIPNDAWVAGPGVDDELARRIKEVLLSMDQTTKTADGQIILDYKNGFPGAGWSERGVAFYEQAADLLLYGQK